MQNSGDTSLDQLLQQLSEASSAGDLEQAKVIFQQWKGLNHSSPRPLESLQPALHIAASKNQASIVSYFLGQGLYVDKVAVNAALSAKATGVLQAYLDHGWDINQSLGLGGGPALTARTVLDDEELLTWFLVHGARPDAPTDSGRTALDVAAWTAPPSVLQRLLQHGGTIGRTNALHMAVRSPKPGRREVIEYLLEAGADINAIEYAGMDSRRDQSGLGTALHYAAREGREDLVSLLLEKGADPEVEDTLGRTASEVAKEANHPQLVSALSVAKKV